LTGKINTLTTNLNNQITLEKNDVQTLTTNLNTQIALEASDVSDL